MLLSSLLSTPGSHNRRCTPCNVLPSTLGDAPPDAAMRGTRPKPLLRRAQPRAASAPPRAACAGCGAAEAGRALWKAAGAPRPREARPGAIT